jgi:hypothetical protein
MKKTYTKFVVILLTGILNIAFSLPISPFSDCVAAEDIAQMKATVVKVAGDVRVKSRASLTWHNPKVNEVLGAGDRLETGKNGLIEIKLDNDNVISLKSDTKITLTKLTQNLKTGDYENLLEAAKGKIRAKVEKIKGNSKFEIKTPTAVAAVRGTTMYLDILSHLTTAFFEGGNGTLTNTFSNETENVGDGNSSSADNQGNVTNPAPASEEQQSQWESGWDVAGGPEGYTPPAGEGAAPGEGLPPPPEEPAPPTSEDPASPI